ncbi:hypothetical protein VTK73DRAFT_1337 [Phialemonium thermophilum]|uniref:RNase MRP protein 1 RNA binding domain-containing protein n=1 Tax=Phialemonium thermophilum TaxID=223376 RepID=A0ABR3XAS7_9PEZI
MALDQYDVTVLQEVLDRLSPVLHILDGFNHRNKNQHRLSRWWAPFDMFRRAVNKLAFELQTSIRRAALQSKKRKRKHIVCSDSGTITIVDEKLGARARHLREHLVPRSYLAFSQLAADNQHAHLGLALLGVLAQADQALSQLAPREAATTSMLPLDRDLVVEGRAELTTTAGPVPPSPPIAYSDLGVSVSRIDVDQSARPKQRQSSSAAATVAPGQEAADPKTSESLKTVGSSKGTKPVPAAKRQKSIKDEFDEVFGSLEEKRPKKKKSKKRDEFDDLFSSLV